MLKLMTLIERFYMIEDIMENIAEILIIDGFEMEEFFNLPSSL
jgi:hypothetical protein